MQLGGILGAGLFVLSVPPTLLHQRACGLASHLLEAPGSFGLTASSSCSPTHGPTSPRALAVAQNRRPGGDPGGCAVGRLRSPGRQRPGGRWVLHSRKPVVLRARPADPEGELVSNIPAVASRSSGSLTAARAALRRSTPAPACTMPLLYPKPNPLQKANLCSRLFFW